MGTLQKQSNPQKALRYFTMGLTAREIGKLLDLSPRTVERYMTVGEWKRETDDRTLQQKALSLTNNGKSYSETAKELGVCKTTVYNYLKRERAK
jgi:DNA-binding NarL/FixJ family response regulator